MKIDPGYVLALSGLDAWPLQSAASVALSAPLGLTPKADKLRWREVQALWGLLAEAVKGGELAVVACRPSEPARVVETYPRARRFGSAASEFFGSVSAPAPVRKRVPERHFHAWATVRPAAVSAWLHKSGRRLLADELARVAEALEVRAPVASVPDGTIPDLSKASHEDRVRWVVSTFWSGQDPVSRDVICEALAVAGVEPRDVRRAVAKDARPANAPKHVGKRSNAAKR